MVSVTIFEPVRCNNVYFLKIKSAEFCFSACFRCEVLDQISIN